MFIHQSPDFAQLIAIVARESSADAEQEVRRAGSPRWSRGAWTDQGWVAIAGS